MKIQNLNNCTGCSACSSVCPKNAIAMISNVEGFIYPKIEVEKCIKCGICEKVCPALKPIEKINENTKAYASVNKNEEKRMTSSSGGIFTALAEAVIAEGGIVFGAKFADDFSVVHSWTDHIEELSNFRGSKYLQSAIEDTYKDCKFFLDQGRMVLFSGTPCQIHGLKKYLGIEYENLIAIDFICHGVPSPLLWGEYIKFREKKSASRTVKTAFRRKNYGWKQFSLSFTFANDSEYCASVKKDPYMQLFLKDIALRKSCYNCPARGIMRPSDITLADFWGIENIIPEMDDDKGTSLVICHSLKGQKLLTNISSTCSFFEVSLHNAIKYNQSMIFSPTYRKKRNLFYSDLQKYPFDKVLKKYAFTPIWKKIICITLSELRKVKRLFFSEKSC